MKPVRLRIDAALVERGLAPTRTQAQALIMAGRVRVGTEVVSKAGALVASDAALHVEQPSRYVSRGGDKMEGALRDFEAYGLNPEGKTCLDVGASTGGFTDCLLQHGALHVFAVDVGYGQLAERLRRDPRVTSRERTNAKLLRAGDFPVPIDLVVVDASFIGLGKLIIPIATVLRQGGELVALVKPQFEAGREAVRQARGVIRDPGVRAEAIDHALEALEHAGFALIARSDAKLQGPKGNVEHFAYARLTKK